MAKQKAWKLGSIKYYKYGFDAGIVTIDWYLFQLIVHLRPDLICCNSFALSRVDKVTTGT